RPALRRPPKSAVHCAAVQSIPGYAPIDWPEAPMSSIPETRYAKSGDTYIAYQVMGDGPFDLVLVPGVYNAPRDASTAAVLREFRRATGRLVSVDPVRQKGNRPIGPSQCNPDPRGANGRCPRLHGRRWL